MTPPFGSPIKSDENWLYEVRQFKPAGAFTDGEFFQVAAGTVKANTMTDARNKAFEQLDAAYQNYLTHPNDSQYYELLLFSLE